MARPGDPTIDDDLKNLYMDEVYITYLPCDEVH